MDTPPQPAPQQVIECSCRHCRRRWWWPFGALFRFIGFIIVLAIVFLVGLIIGGPGVLPFGRATLQDAGDGISTPRMMMFRAGAGDFRFKFGADDRQFGVITAIAGQQVTIADNGGGTQSVLVTSETSIFDGEKEVPMWKLQRGNSVRVYGGSKDGVITAKLIEIIR